MPKGRDQILTHFVFQANSMVPGVCVTYLPRRKANVMQMSVKELGSLFKEKNVMLGLLVCVSALPKLREMVSTVWVTQY